ncbi:MAG: DNA internalization-related competence protein ComEC/Rec2 [Thermincolia bacterium]
MKRPLLGAALAFLVGVFAGGWQSLPWLVLAIAGMVLLFLLGIGYFYRKAVVWWLCLLLVAYGGLVYHQVVLITLPINLVEEAGQGITLRGSIIEEPWIEKNRVRYVVEVEKYQRAGSQSWQGVQGDKVLVSQRDPGRLYPYGQGVEIRGVLRMPRMGGNPGDMDYPRFLKGQGIATVMSIQGDEDLRAIGERGGNIVFRSAGAMRDSLAKVASDTLDPDDAGLLNGLVFGLREGLNPSVIQVFERIGLVHILSVSGLHVNIVAGALVFLIRVAGLPKKLGLILAMAGVLAYGYLVGFVPPVARSVIMLEMLLVGMLVGREREWSTALTVAALAIVMENPATIYSPGFQLSFIATWAILFLNTPIYQGLAKFFPEGWLTSAISLSLAAQMGTWLLVAYYFNLVSLISLPANIALVVLVTPITWLGLGAALVGQVLPGLAWFINGANAVLLKLLVWLAGLFDQVPAGSFNIPSLSWWVLILWYGLLLLLGDYIKNPRLYLKLNNIFRIVRDWWTSSHRGSYRAALLSVAGLTALFFLWAIGFIGSSHRLEITFLDVGAGDSIYVKTPEGRHILLDAGRGPLKEGDFDVGAKVVVPFLKRQGVNHLDALIISHHHLDHGGGIPSVLANFPVDLAVMPPAEELEQQLEDRYKPILEAIRREVSRIETVGEGDILELGEGIMAEILAPPEPILTDTTADLNNNSLVIKLTYKEKSFLFTGDIENPMIDELVGGKTDLAAHVLKVPHHGSAGSYNEDFYRQVGAQVAIINVGPNNYGHPHQRVLEGLAAQGMKVIRTDISGAVTVSTDGKEMQIKTVK